MSETTATILSAIIAAILGGAFALVGVWVGYYLGRRASEGDRHTELQFTIYTKAEGLKNLLLAFKKKMITRETLHEKWTRTTEEVLTALIRSGLSKAEKKKVLHAINGRWENPESIEKLQRLADDLLKKLDSDFAEAANELLNELGVKPEDIDPVILTSKATRE